MVAAASGNLLMVERLLGKNADPDALCAVMLIFSGLVPSLSLNYPGRLKCCANGRR